MSCVQVRRLAQVAVAVIGVTFVAPLGAQMIPDIKGPIDKAKNARDATDRKTSEQTGQALPARAGAKPAAAPPAQAPGGKVSGPAATVGQSPASTAARLSTAAPVGITPVTREVFTYAADGRRDPFFSLILTEDLRPLLSDLKLVGIMYSASGKSVAIMKDILTNAQYRVNTGMTLGRMRVTQIKPRAVIFTLDDFGMSRQDSLFLVDSTRVRIK